MHNPNKWIRCFATSVAINYNKRIYYVSQHEPWTGYGKATHPTVTCGKTVHANGNIVLFTLSHRCGKNIDIFLIFIFFF